MFIALNGWRWRDQPSVDDAEATVLAVAAGQIHEAQVAKWLRPFLVEPS